MVTARRLRVVFFGTPEFAVPTLDALLASPHQVVGVVTQPDRPRGRGQRVSDAPVKARAFAAALPVLQPATLKDPAFVAALEALRVDIGVVAAYGKILTDAVLAVPPLGMVNVHASLLPRYRGAAPVHRAIIAGELETGVTIMRVVRALDAGPMLARMARPIGSEETSLDVERGLATLGAALLASTLDRLADGRIEEIPQNEQAATYAARITKEDGAIDWNATARAIHDRIRGLHPWPHAYTFLSAARLIVHRSSPRSDQPSSAPGTVLIAHGDRLSVAAGVGIVDIQEIQAEGKRPLATRDFLAGHSVTPGARFTNHP